MAGYTTGIEQHFIPIGTGKPQPRPPTFDPTLVERLNRLPNTSETVFDFLQSKNFATGVSGFRIDQDGTAEFASGITLGPGAVTLAADLLSSNWGGADPADLSSGPDETGSPAGYYLDYSAGAAQFESIFARGGQVEALTITGLLSMTGAGDIKANWDGDSPADLSSVDGTATTGYYLDGSVGAAQFQSIFAQGGQLDTLSVTGTLTMSSTGEILSNSGYPRIRISDDVTGSGTAAAIEFLREAGEFHGIFATDDYLYMNARDDVGTGGNNGVFSLGGNPAISQPRVYLGNKFGFATDQIHLDMWNFDDTTVGFLLQSGANFSAAELGAGNAAMQFDSQGDSTGFRFDANPTTAEDHTIWEDGGVAFGGINHLGQLMIPAGLVGTPGLVKYGEEDTGIWFSAADTINVSLGGVEKFEFGAAQHISTEPILFPDGSAATPSVQVGAADTGLYHTGDVGMSVNGTLLQSWASTSGSKIWNGDLHLAAGLEFDVENEGIQSVDGSKMLGVNNNGLTVNSIDDYLPNFEGNNGASISSGIVNNAYTTTGNVITLWDHTGTDRSVHAQATGTSLFVYTAAGPINVFLRLGISIDGGSTWTYGHNPNINIGTAAGARTKDNIPVQHFREGVATGDVQARTEYYVVGSTDPTGINLNAIQGSCWQLH